ncbi:MAG: restriction endonuclease subunit S [Chloroflexi bacterium]|nr:MAG: restriction endonuclease subunit S [Chloroflexota bacterium]RLC81783.1 MAG: restriction endonuclease subunit S [Chloroflexota bacterium]
MKWRAYPKYKDSGIEWAGKVPEHWEVIRLKYAFVLQRGFDLASDKFIDGCYPVCASNGIIGYHNQWTTAGPSVTVGRSGSVGEVNFIESDFWAHNTALYIKHFKRMEPRFAYYLLKTVDLKSLSAGTAVGTLNRNYIHDLPIANPVLPEQHAIAAFLDRKTTHIDALIAKKERHIELLQEKRAALISHAVTKGLDPTVPMKDSGVEWLGEIPAHWEMKRLKHIISLVTSGSRGWARYYSESGDVFLRMGNLNRDSIDLDLSEIQYVRPPSGTEGERTQVRSNDILISITAYVGTVGLVPNGLGKAYVNQHTALLRPQHKQVNARWLAHCISSTVVQPQFAITEIGGTKVGIGLDDLRDITLVYPPLGEQEDISMHLDSQISRIARSIAKVQESITTLREYRTALISAAVTGKIDVRQEAV